MAETLPQPQQPEALKPGPAAPVGKPSLGADRLRAAHAESKKRPGSKPGVARGPYRKSDGSPDTAPAADPAAQVFTEDNVRRLVRVPFSVAAVRTSYGGWLLSPAEEREIAASLVPCLNEWAPVEPRWAALFLACYSLGSVAVSHYLDYAGWKEAMRLSAQGAPPPAADKPEPAAQAPAAKSQPNAAKSEPAAPGPDPARSSPFGPPQPVVRG